MPQQISSMEINNNNNNNNNNNKRRSERKGRADNTSDNKEHMCLQLTVWREQQHLG